MEERQSVREALPDTGQSPRESARAASGRKLGEPARTSWLSARRVQLGLVLLISIYGLVMSYRAGQDPKDDFRGWFRAAERWQAGETLYFHQEAATSEMPNKHGLPFVVLFAPLTGLGIAWAARLWILVSVLLLLHGLHLLSRILALVDPLPPPVWVLRFGPWLGLLLIAPFLHNLILYRQTGIFLLWWMILGIYCLARNRDFLAGLILAVPAAIKLLPLVFLPWLVFKRRMRAAAGFMTGFLLAFALPFAFEDAERTARHLNDYAQMLLRDEARDNQYPGAQSLRPLVLATITPHYEPGPLVTEDYKQELIQRWDGRRNYLASEGLFRFQEWILLLSSAVFVALCALWISSGYGENADPRPPPLVLLGESGLVLATMLFISPLAWKHYYVWLLPAAVFVIAAAIGGWARHRFRAWIALSVFVLFLTLPHKGLLRLFSSELAEGYGVFHGYASALGLFCLLLGWALRAETRAAKDAEDTDWLFG
ncbi:MAG: glycosyltransferase family 87 protein, partial [Planctomycetota bacterium]